MSFEYKKWEEGLPPLLENHEFDFDESAWTEMDAILDQANATAAPPDTGPTAGAGHFGPWLFGIMLVGTIAIFSWWLHQKTINQERVLSNFSVQHAVQENSKKPINTAKNTPSISSAGSIETINPPTRQSLPALVTISSSQEQPITIPGTETADELMTLDRSAAYITPLLDPAILSVLPILQQEKPDLELFLDKRKRKRNRENLFPDVLDNY